METINCHKAGQSRDVPPATEAPDLIYYTARYLHMKYSSRARIALVVQQYICQRYTIITVLKGMLQRSIIPKP